MAERTGTASTDPAGLCAAQVMRWQSTTCVLRSCTGLHCPGLGFKDSTAGAAEEFSFPTRKDFSCFLSEA